MIKDAKPCPFCGSNDLGISTSSGRDCYYKAVYCKKCHCYGPRLRWAVDRSQFAYNKRYEFEHDTETDEKAINMWNNRMERIKV